MKKIICILFFCLCLTTTAFAFLYDVKVYTVSELKKLSNDELITVYKSAVIERKANETFHGKAGFTPKEYQNYKELLGLIIDIRQEMKLREMEAPPIEEWLR